ncbi:MAG: hypothetical protein IPM54_30660 [Polyangiaceae bacterium]|nr:hypothetical protein [Polyangiaceae bacterium]
MRIVASIFAMGALVLAARSAGAEEAISPPPGWEVPPVAPEPKEKPAKEKKAVGPACCAFDQTCCSRQADIDKAVRPRVAVRIIDVRAADLPEAMLKEAAEGEPPIEGAPPVRLINEQGQPFPMVVATDANTDVAPWADGRACVEFGMAYALFRRGRIAGPRMGRNTQYPRKGAV